MEGHATIIVMNIRFLILFIVLWSSLSFSSSADLLTKESNNYSGSEVFCHSPLENNGLNLYQHCYIRLIHKDDYYKDIAVNFQVQTSTGNNLLESIPLVIGAYPMKIYIQSFSEVWSKYFFSGEVQSFRAIINTNQTQLNSLINEIHRLHLDPELIGKYTLLSNNCVGAIVKLFKNSNIIEDNINSEFHPKDFSNWLIDNKVTYLPIQKISPNLIKNELVRIFGLTVEKLALSKNWPLNSFDILQNNFYIDRSELKRIKLFRVLLYSDVNMPLSLRKKLSSLYKLKSSDSYAKLSSLAQLPTFYYEGDSFYNQQNQFHFSSEDLLNFYFQHIKSLNPSYDSINDKINNYFSFHKLTSFLFKNVHKRKASLKLKMYNNQLLVGPCSYFSNNCSTHSNFFKDNAITLPLKVMNNSFYFNGKDCGSLHISKNKIGDHCHLAINKSSKHSNTRVSLYIHFSKKD